MFDGSPSLAERFKPKEFKVLTAEPQVHAARFTPCGQFLVAGGFDAKIRRWNMEAPEPAELPLLNGHNGWVHALAFQAERRWMISGDSWGQMRASPYADEMPTVAWKIDQAHDGWVRDLDVSPDGRLVASCGSDQAVRLWNSENGNPVANWTGHGNDVFCVRFHPDGKHLLSGDDRGVVKLWEIASGSATREFDARSLYVLNRLQDVGGLRALAISGDGSLVACGGTVPKNGGTVQGAPTVLVFDFASGELRHTSSLGGPNDCYVHDIVLHDEGFFMAVTSGTPGQGKLVLQKIGDNEPFFVSTAMANCHSLSLAPKSGRFAVVATNRNSNGNGKQLDKNGKYPDNSSPIHVFEFSVPQEKTAGAG